MTRNTCKLILVLMACAAPLMAAVGSAEPSRGSTGGLYAPGYPRSGSAVDPGAHPQPAAPSEGQPLAKTNPAPAPSRANGLGAEERPSASVKSSPSGEQRWIVAVAGLGLLISLAAAGYHAWSRARQTGVPVTVILPSNVTRPSNYSPGLPAADKEQRPERRAA